MSDESEDEPLSILATVKNRSREKVSYEPPSDDDFDDSDDYEPRKKKSKKVVMKKLGVSISVRKRPEPVVIERPADVWLYLKDLNPTGPYSCLMCPEWFLNKAKMVMHYVINHKRDFCGICRYFVPNRTAWLQHSKFHLPWSCSQCNEKLATETELKKHLSEVHNLIHCRICHYLLPDDDQYNTHLQEKHNVTVISKKNDPSVWELEYEGSTKFLCLFCSKSILVLNYFNHYMGYHHFTIKCFTNIICGKEPAFSIKGANISAEFIENHLKEHPNYGYIEISRTKIDPVVDIEVEVGPILNMLIPEIKQENVSDNETEQPESKPEPKQEPVPGPKLEEEVIKKVEAINDLSKTYKGEEDFDCTLTELIVFQNAYYKYLSHTISMLKCNVVPVTSAIEYEDTKDVLLDVVCSLCKTKHNTAQTLISHMWKTHFIKHISNYSCRVCATTFESEYELNNHQKEELGDFEDLWICQFCDKEFDNREMSRKHLTEHWDILEYDNCFSPHLGFKCKFCPNLFWNETDRETHQVRTHVDAFKDQFYRCSDCSEIFSDKIWFNYHYVEKHGEKCHPQQHLLKCSVCCLVLADIEDMRAHFRRKHPSATKIFCTLDACLYRPLSHKKSFTHHVKHIHNPSIVKVEKPATCAVCGREFMNARACTAHVAQVHGSGKFKCKICQATVHTMDERKLHYMLKHPGRHPFECSECGKSFQYKSSLYMHKQEHSPNKHAYACSYCHKVFAKKDSYREHVQIHLGPRHACSYCPMRFVQRSNMMRHERRHTGERPYTCTQCPRTFADKGACSSHAKTHSQTTPYTCMYCGTKFVQKSKLNYHIRKHTGENLETCEVCSKIFTSACSLREHMKIHNRKKSEYSKCPICGVKRHMRTAEEWNSLPADVFPEKYDLDLFKARVNRHFLARSYHNEKAMQRHVKAAHSDETHRCPICDKNLSSASGLRHHIVTHSKAHMYRCNICPKSSSVRRTMISHLRKRHSLVSNQINLKDFYRILDPRDCNLDLDEELITKIYGPRKTEKEGFMTDLVTLSKKIADTVVRNALSKGKGKGAEEQQDESEGEENEDSEDESEKESESEESKPEVVKEESKHASEDELEPTDFVSVKIEPIDDIEEN